MASTPEAKVKAEIRKILDKHGVLYSMPIGSPYGTSNMCDFICCVPTESGVGQYMEIEAKATPRNKPSVRQADKLEQVRKAGGVAVVVNNKTLNEFEALVANTRRGRAVVPRLRDERSASTTLVYAGCPYPTEVKIVSTLRNNGQVSFDRHSVRISLSSSASIGTVAHEAVHAAIKQYPNKLVETITYDDVKLMLPHHSHKSMSPEDLLEEVRCAYVTRVVEDIAKIYAAMNKQFD